MVGLAAIGGQIWLKSKYKVPLALVVVGGIWFTIPFLDENLTDRYKSLISSDTKNAGTANERVDGMWINFEVAMRRPLFGYGLGTSQEANWNFGGLDLPAHNLYLEALQEIGIVGLVLFLMFVSSLLAGLRSAARAFKATKDPPPIVVHLVPALQVFIGMNILFSFATYGLSMYDWYFSAGLIDVIGRLLIAAPAADSAEETVAAQPAPFQWVASRI
jgi:O-antigen ligase